MSCGTSCDTITTMVETTGMRAPRSDSTLSLETVAAAFSNHRTDAARSAPIVRPKARLSA